MSLVRIKNILKICGKGRAKVVSLDNISLKIRKGEFLVIIETSQSGDFS